jgi:hypothetical protein
VLDEFSARSVATEVIEHLERRRADIVGDDAQIRAEVKRALVPLRKSYVDTELPMAYMDALEAEMSSALPTRWGAVAKPFTDLEKQRFRIWRGGDLVARIGYVFLGLMVGALCVELPFIPIFWKGFPFLLAGLAFWLPDAQIRFQRRAYARALGGIVRDLEGAQPALDRHITVAELLPPDPGPSSSPPSEKP